jgi:hypothetical protein
MKKDRKNPNKKKKLKKSQFFRKPCKQPLATNKIDPKMSACALPLLVPGGQSQVRVSPDGLEALSRFPSSNLVVLAVTGVARTGKSALLNLIVHRLSNEPVHPQSLFVTGETTDPVTKGVHLWSRPLPLPGGKHLLLLDVEGGLRGDATSVLKSTTLATLMSTILVFNSVKDLNHTVWDGLGAVYQASQTVKTDPGVSRKAIFPKLWVVLRDSHLKPTVDGDPVTPALYLASQLSDDNVRRRIGGDLGSALKNPDLFIVDSPTPAERSDLDARVPLEDGGDFARSINRLIDSLVKDLSSKAQISVAGESSGPGLAAFVEVAVELLNASDDELNYASLPELISQRRMAVLVVKATAEFKEAVRTAVPDITALDELSVGDVGGGSGAKDLKRACDLLTSCGARFRPEAAQHLAKALQALDADAKTVLEATRAKARAAFEADARAWIDEVAKCIAKSLEHVKLQLDSEANAQLAKDSLTKLEAELQALTLQSKKESAEHRAEREKVKDTMDKLTKELEALRARPAINTMDMSQLLGMRGLGMQGLGMQGLGMQGLGMCGGMPGFPGGGGGGGFGGRPSFGGGRQILTGPRGGQYYINGNGNKTYLR